MADDSQNCLLDSQTMSEIGNKNTTTGHESSPIKPKMTDVISEQRPEEETSVDESKTTPNAEFDSCVTQPLSGDNTGEQQDGKGDTDQNKTAEECPQVTQAQPPVSLPEEDSQNINKSEMPPESIASETAKLSSDCTSKVEDDTSPVKSGDTESGPSTELHQQSSSNSSSCATRDVNASLSHQNNTQAPPEMSQPQELTPKPEPNNDEPSSGIEEETKDGASVDQQLADSVAKKEEQVCSKEQIEPVVTSSVTTGVPLPQSEVSTATSESQSGKSDVAAELSGLRVALPDIESNKSDIACAPPGTTDASIAASSSQPSTSKSTSTTQDKTPPESVYHVKWVQLKNQSTPIVTQNENGPCPLLAIMNCLLLQGRVKLPPMMEMVTSSQLMEYLGDCILGNAPKNITEDAQLNYEQNMQDAMDVFHKLQTGLDVNVRFTGVSDFEYTRECIVFDLLNIPLYHGWLVDPESPEVVAAIGNCSYNQLVEKIISQKNSSREELMTEALIAEEYLERSAAQLTYHGLSELVTSVKEGELCVFFRNNHFSTLYKHKKELFLLVTDQGFLTETNVVWETLSNVEGDGHFVDADFRTFRKPDVSTTPIAAPDVPLGTNQQIDQDYLVALSLQQEQQGEPSQSVGAVAPGTAQAAWPQPTDSGIEPTLSDHELALRLQEEEDRRAANAVNQRQAHAADQRQGATGPTRTALQHQSSTASSSGGSRKDKKSDCTIL